MGDELADVLAELREIRSAIEGLRDDIEAIAARGRLSRDERTLLAALFPRAAAVVGGAVFAAVDLYDLPELRPLLGDYSAGGLSWLFNRCQGSRISGFRVERVGTDRSGALWQLRPEVTATAKR